MYLFFCSNNTFFMKYAHKFTYSSWQDKVRSNTAWLLVCSTVSAKALSSTFRKIIYLAKLSSKKGHTPYFQKRS